MLIGSKQSFAEIKMGIGSSITTFLSFGSNGTTNSINTISLPLKFNNNIMIEPELIYLDSDKTDSDGDKTTTNTKGLRIGMFFFVNSESRIRPYFGGKIGISKYESKRTFSSSNFNLEDNETHKFISPTIGAEVEIIENFSIATEIAFTYAKSDEETSINTDSRLMVRVFF